MSRTRRLAAILAADVAGYSRLMGADEEGTHERLKAHLSERAEHLAGEALATSPRHPLAHYAKGQVLRAQGHPEEAIPEYETALASDRNWVNAYSALGYCKLYSGLIDGVILLVEQAIRLSPRDPEIGNCYFRIGQIHMVQSRTD